MISLLLTVPAVNHIAATHGGRLKVTLKSRDDLYLPHSNNHFENGGDNEPGNLGSMHPLTAGEETDGDPGAAILRT
jgi:hypothetical protein